MGFQSDVGPTGTYNVSLATSAITIALNPTASRISGKITRWIPAPPG